MGISASLGTDTSAAREIPTVLAVNTYTAAGLLERDAVRTFDRQGFFNSDEETHSHPTWHPVLQQFITELSPESRGLSPGQATSRVDSRRLLTPTSVTGCCA